ncbi:MAG: hypothetical protein IT287_05350 [Bdellovibrionaceae bacterium]|nr:hypothetical protein [Pseudobdellovibrionaceae bacterium]
MLPMTFESIKNLAQKMNYVSFDVLQVQDQSVKSHWYRHEEGIDIYYFQKEDGSFIKLHISFFGQVIEWNPLDGTRTGLLVEQEQGNEVVETVHYDARANSQSLAQSLMIIENANCIAQDLRDELTVLLQLPQGQAPKGSKAKDGFWAQFFLLFRFK